MKDHTWETWKLSHAYGRIGSGTTPTSSDARYYTSSDGIPWVTTAELREKYISATQQQLTPEALANFPALRVYGPDSVMVAMYGATIGRLGMIEVAAACNQACCVFESSDRFDNRFLFYWLWHRRGALIALSVGGGQPNLSQQDLREERALCPPLETQQRIARFLDEKTARIDGLIEKKRALLDRLAEKRQALITRAVTKGLNPDASMKPSGIDWLGDIPAHWSLIPFKWRCKVKSGQVDPKQPEYAEMILIAPDHIESGTGRLHEVTNAEEQGAISGKFLCPAGSILYSKIRPELRKVALYDGECLCSADMYAISPGRELVSEYLFYFLLTDAFTSYAELESLRVAMPKVNREALGAFPVPTPNRDEQRKIALFCEQVDLKHREATDRVRDSIERLEEYRTAQIAAAVTGQLAELR